MNKIIIQCYKFTTLFFVVLCISISMNAQDFTYFNKKVQLGNYPSSVVNLIEEGYCTVAPFEIAGYKACMWVKLDFKGNTIVTQFVDHDNRIVKEFLTGDLSVVHPNGKIYLLYTKHKVDEENSYDIALVSFTQNGEVDIKTEYKTEASEKPTFLKVLENGDLLIGGIQNSGSSSKYYVARIDSRGKVLWEKTYGDRVVGNASITIGGDYFLLLGSTKTTNNGEDMLLFSIKEDGETNWTKTYGGESDESASQIGSFPNKNYLLAGIVKEGETVKQYYVKIDESGKVIKDNTYYKSGIGSLETQLLPSLEGEGFIAVAHQINDKGYQQPLIIRINDEAEVLWTISTLTPESKANIIVKDIEVGQNQNGYVITGSDSDPTAPYGWVASFDYTGVHCSTFGCDSTDVVTGIKDINRKATINIYPNPIETNYTISYDFPQISEISPTFHVYNLRGELVKSFVLDASKKSMSVDTSELESGMYLYSATYRGINLVTGKLILK